MGNGKENMYTDVRVLRVELQLTFEDRCFTLFKSFFFC